MATITPKNLNSIMDFGYVIRVAVDGTVSELADVYLPEILYATDDDVTGQLPDGWDLLTGYTGQSGYRGPVMHSSEFIGGGLARDILARPGDYVAVVVDADVTDDDSEPVNVGWAVAFRPAD
jgi:hypothetical protein